MKVSRALSASALATVLALTGLSSTSASAQMFSYTGTIVSWTAPTSGFYQVTAEGAQGASATDVFAGGLGAELTGTFHFNAGELFWIAVGGAGSEPDPQQGSGNGGGGGGTFFVDQFNNPLLIAGGGGGTRAAAQQNGTDASITQYAFTGSGWSTTYTPTLKTDDLGLGGDVSAISYGSGGAGFYGNGANDGSWGTGGSSWLNGLAGGTNTGCSGAGGTGGFGGGGAGAGCWGGGGGGGYSGGDGGLVAGGGGSFNVGTNQSALAGVGYGDGYLNISFLSGSAVPEPGTWAMMLIGFGAIGVSMRRKRKTLLLQVA